MAADGGLGTGQMARDTVAVLGADEPIGFPVARNLARAGFDVRAWHDRKCGPGQLSEHGAYIADSPEDAARGAGIVLTMLPGVDAVMSVMQGGVLDIMRETDREDHAIWLQMAPIGEAATQRCIWLAGRYGVGFVDAPVVGGDEAADGGSLTVLESGPEEARPRVQPIFDAIGDRTIRAGEAAEAARLNNGTP